MKRAFPFGLVFAVSAGALGAFGAVPRAAAAQPTPPYLGSFPDFEAQLTPQQLPGDVDVALKSRLEWASKFPLVQRLFDLWSWQAFISLNWPTDGTESAPATPRSLRLGRYGPGARTSFCRTARRPPCAGRARNSLQRRRRIWKLMLARGYAPTKIPAQIDTRRVRLLAVTSAVNDLSALVPTEDIKQAFSGPIIDQNGNFVFYEILIDKHELDYICQNKLYSKAGQEEFAKTHSAVDLPSGVDTEDASGAFELKLAWKILTASDDASRYLTEKALISIALTGGASALPSTPSRSGSSACTSRTRARARNNGYGGHSSRSTISMSMPSHIPSSNLRSSIRPARSASPIKNPNTRATPGLKTPKTQIVRSIPIPPDKQCAQSRGAGCAGENGIAAAILPAHRHAMAD